MQIGCNLLALAATVAALAAPQPSGASDDASIESEIVSDRSAAAFVHPGVFIDSARMNLMATKVAAKAEPWNAAYSALAADSFATRVSPTPVKTVQCGPTSTPDVGCRQELDDSMAAYANALLWVVTKNKAKATRAMTFMNAWARTVKSHTYSNAPLQAAWVASNWARAAEIIRYTNAGWSQNDIVAFEAMLRNVYLPLVKNGSRNPNNWELIFNEATIGIAVFLNDRKTYDDTLKRFLRSAAQYFYLESDGPRPVRPAGLSDTQQDSWWSGQIARGLKNGIGMEVCRDLAHTGYGIASVSHVIETSKIQGRDLYHEEVGTRLRYAMEFHTKYDPSGGAVLIPSWLCNGKLSLHVEDVTEPGWNALRNKFSMPYSGNFTLKRRPANSRNGLWVGWETLTHAQ
ncbi:hypothetical protein PWT90_04581 [Aphanocladium album]|nr:hypothetical protein PWT90_04581 [Aphanocladium album]